MIWDIITWVAFLTNLVGNVLLAWKYVSGWPIRIIPNVLWVLFAIHIDNTAMFANSITFFVLNVVGWWRWSRKSTTVIPRCAHTAIKRGCSNCELIERCR